MKVNDIPENYKVIKPWGSEYTIYKNSTTSTKLLKIDQIKVLHYIVTLKKNRIYIN